MTFDEHCHCLVYKYGVISRNLNIEQSSPILYWQGPVHWATHDLGRGGKAGLYFLLRLYQAAVTGLIALSRHTQWLSSGCAYTALCKQGQKSY